MNGIFTKVLTHIIIYAEKSEANGQDFFFLYIFKLHTSDTYKYHICLQSLYYSIIHAKIYWMLRNLVQKNKNRFKKGIKLDWILHIIVNILSYDFYDSWSLL